MKPAMNKTPRRHPLALALLGALASLPPAMAQTVAPFDDGARYQPLLSTSVEPSAPPLVVLDGMYAANARVGQLRVEVYGAGAPADGVTPVTVKVLVYDRRGEPLKEPVLVTIEHSGGARVQLPDAPTDEFGPGRRDADRRVPGTQLKVQDGQATFSLIAPSQPEDTLLRLTAGAAEVSGSITFVPDLREMIGAGLVEGMLRISRTNTTDATVLAAGLDDGFEAALKHWSRSFDQGRGEAALRSALFLKGKISGETLLTLTYDSDKDVNARLLSNIKPEEFYPVYGDASVKGFEAKSASRLYVRVDRGRSFVLWGDFSTADGFAQAAGSGQVAGTRLRQLGAYSRSVTGARLHHERADGFVNVYASRDTLKQLVEEVRANGTSGPFAVSNTHAVELSEKVEILVRDRNNLNTILSVTPLVRLNDYNFEPFSGRILLNRPVPSLDTDGNPLSLRITYEVDQGGEPFWLLGADGQVNLGSRVTVGGSVVDDQNPNARFRLASVNTGVKLGERTTLVAELAMTEANLTVLNTGITTPAVTPDPEAPTTRGRAGRVVIDHQGERWSARLYANRAGRSFANGAAGVTPGTGQRAAHAEERGAADPGSRHRRAPHRRDARRRLPAHASTHGRWRAAPHRRARSGQQRHVEPGCQSGRRQLFRQRSGRRFHRCRQHDADQPEQRRRLDRRGARHGARPGQHHRLPGCAVQSNRDDRRARPGRAFGRRRQRPSRRAGRHLPAGRAQPALRPCRAADRAGVALQHRSGGAQHGAGLRHRQQLHARRQRLQ